MLEYKSIVIVKYTRKSIEEAIDQTITDMLKLGWSFVQMSTLNGGIILLFSRDKFNI